MVGRRTRRLPGRGSAEGEAFLANDQQAEESVEGLMRRREPWSTATLEEGGQASLAHYEGVFRCLGRHRGRLIAYSLVFEDPASLQDPDSDTDSEGPGTGSGSLGPGVGTGGPPLEGSIAELEWDPTGDVGWLGALRSRTVWTPGSPCDVCGRAEPLADRKQPSPEDVPVLIPTGSEGPKEGRGPRWPRRTLFFLLLLLLLGAACLLPPPGGPHCPPPRLPGPLHLVLSYVNGPPPT
ncbi:nesprin-4 isoform X2 [Gracilinanus agilis]|uniref:nesprin-4 isoform X2 n=1 Tax=Gracilinanus agilis TaxID=191870 RepID=UPI001CFDBF59|nr:nesprin-4 isoform X2 [Gracilinanus agilis]